MKKRLYLRLAVNNIKSSYRFFIPRMLCQAGLLAVFYISVTLATDKRLAEVRGGSYIPTFMLMGTGVLVLLSAILMFYTNSFLMKQRKREFGIYSVLGMEKRHVGRVMFHESFLSDTVSIAAGLLLGMLFYKLCSLLICRLLQTDIVAGFYFISAGPVIISAGFFAVLDVLTYIINRISVSKMNPLELLQSRSAGEKEPRVKWLMLAAGTLSLAAGYYLALAVKNPLEALLMFFVAVILVIIGTYFLFVSGSVFVLKALKNSRKYYYTKRHMPAVSGLLYRMKRNAVGLASVAILSTGVLVMISTTVTLYSGYQQTLDSSYPQHLYMDVVYNEKDGEKGNIPGDVLEGFVRDAAAKCGVGVESAGSSRYLLVSYKIADNVLYTTKDSGADSADLGAISIFIFITQDTCEMLGGGKMNLADDEIALCRISSHSGRPRLDTGKKLTLHGKEYSVAREMSVFPVNSAVTASAFDTWGVVVANQGELDRIYQGQTADYGRFASDFTDRLAVTFADLDAAERNAGVLYDGITASVHSWLETNAPGSQLYSFSYQSYWSAKESLLGMYGTLLFLGILLGSVCLFATVLIIYYKQISEGWEDRERFHIMEKIGMSRAEVRKTINSQVLLVFFLPLAAAGMHLCFAAPMLLAMLRVLSLFSVRNYILCAVSTFGVFTLVYILIYTATSKTYYKIVQ